MVLLVAIVGDCLSRANEFFFALVCGVGTLLLLWGGSQFVYKQDVEKHLSESLVEDSVHIGLKCSGLKLKLISHRTVSSCLQKMLHLLFNAKRIVAQWILLL